MNALPIAQTDNEVPPAVLRRYPRYAYDTTWQHDIARCEQGRSPILAALCPCGSRLFGKKRGNGFAFFASLPTSDPHSFQAGQDGHAP